MRKCLTGIIILICSGLVYGQENTTETTPASKDVIILPLVNLSDTNIYTSSEPVNEVIFKSFFNFLGIIPDLNVPSADILMQINKNETNVENILSEYNSDFIIYGDILFEGSVSSPEAIIHLSVMSKETGQNILDITLNTFTDIDILDTIDEMIESLVEVILESDLTLGYISFKDFSIQSDTYTVLINSQEVGHAANSDFNLSLKVLSGYTYQVTISLDRLNLPVYQTFFNIEAGESHEINYTPRGSIELTRFRGRRLFHRYDIFLNDTDITVGHEYDLLPAAMDYTLNVFERKQTEPFYSTNFFLADREKKDVYIGKVYQAKNYYINGLLINGIWGRNNSMALETGGGYFFNPNLWLGANVGIQFRDNDYKGFSITPEIGKYFYNNHADLPRKIKLSYTGGLKFFFLTESIESDTNEVNHFSVTPQIYVSADWLTFRLSAGLDTDFGEYTRIHFFIKTGLRF